MIGSPAGKHAWRQLDLTWNSVCLIWIKFTRSLCEYWIVDKGTVRNVARIWFVFMDSHLWDFYIMLSPSPCWNHVIFCHVYYLCITLRCTTMWNCTAAVCARERKRVRARESERVSTCRRVEKQVQIMKERLKTGHFLDLFSEYF